MTQVLLHIEERGDRVLNIVKGKFGLKNKSDAINLVLHQYEEELLEPELRPEYIKKLSKIDKEKGVPFKNIAELRKIIEG